MMNLNNPALQAGKQAKIRYLDGDYQIVSGGTYVTCAVTGRPIALEDLKYWSVARQEPYVDAASSYKAEMAATK